MTLLSSYWPTAKETNQCIKSEAETASDAVLLAAHQPTPLSFLRLKSEEKEPRSEQDILDAFLTENLPEGTLLFSITGGSGAGKSHVIRWLSAQLARDPRAQNMHVIRIPKSANLKTVVELVLAPLEGNPKYAKARTELHHAVSAVNPNDAAVRFAAELELSLVEKADAIKSEIQSDKRAPNVRQLKNQLTHALKLPGCFTDVALQAHFKGDVLPKIIKRAVAGRVDDDVAADEEMLPQFSIQDLQLPHNVDLGDAAAEVRSYYLTVLNRADGAEYVNAVEVLNSVVDSAIRNVFRLNQAMGGVTIEEIILQIRSLLMEEKKELVLLIEDFAALSGIQEILLRVCIQEAERDGQQERAPMRTALAVTDGYLASRETILSRAGGEWVVESSLPSSEEIVERTTNLIGAYLNAARWGQEKLKTMLKDTMKDPSASLTGWVPVYLDETETPEASKARKAFGENSADVPLFPFSAQAIRSLVEDKLQSGGKIEFNPRAIIKNIIRLLIDERESYSKGTFPPTKIYGRTLKADIAQWLAQSQMSISDQDRYGRLVAYWGGNPDHRNGLGGMPKEIFRVFGLPDPEALGVAVTPDLPQPPPPTTTLPPPVDRDDAYITQWEKTLEDWIAGERLDQASARTIRNVIVAQLNKAIDWNAMCMKPVEATYANIQLPNAMGEGGVEGGANKNKLPITHDPNDKDGNLRRTLLAFLRYDHHGQKLTYPDSDEDTALIANAIDLLIPKYLNIVSDGIAKEVLALSTALVRQGKILGLAPKKVVGRLSVNDSIFSAAPELFSYVGDESSSKGRWNNLREISARERVALQELLKSKVGAFQGAGSTAYAVDIVCLDIGDPDFASDFKDGELGGPQREYLSSISHRKLNSLSKPLLKDLRDVQIKSQNLLGDTFDKIQLCGEIKDLAISVENGRVWPDSFPHKKVAFINKIEAFQKLPVTDVLDQLSGLFKEEIQNDIESILYFLGNIDFQAIDTVDSFLHLIEDFTIGVEKELKQEERNYNGQGLQSITNDVDKALSDINSLIRSLGEGNKTS